MYSTQKYKKLHYIAPGTDLSIELPEGHIWAQGDSINAKGHSFVANMPTEEVFTAPLKTGVNGTVRSTKPLSHGGNIIDDFSISFENGRIISVTAEQGQEALEHLISMDEGAKYLGRLPWFLINPLFLNPTFFITTHCLTKMLLITLL